MQFPLDLPTRAPRDTEQTFLEDLGTVKVSFDPAGIGIPVKEAN